MVNVRASVSVRGWNDSRMVEQEPNRSDDRDVALPEKQ